MTTTYDYHIGVDYHKSYSHLVVQDSAGKTLRAGRVKNDRQSLVNRSACRILCDLSPGHASALPPRDAFITRCRFESHRRSGRPHRPHILDRAHDGPPHDVLEHSAIITANDRERASTIMLHLPPNGRRVARHPSKPIPRLADHLPALRRHSTDNWRA